MLKNFPIILALSIGVAHASPYAKDLYNKGQLSQSFSECADVFPNHNTQLVEKVFSANMRPTPLCSDDFAVLYSKVSKTPLVTVERLNAAMMLDAKGEERTDDFYADPRLKSGERAELSDYKGSGFDRGHQVPAANAVNQRSMAQTFSLSNMIPQDPTHNRKVWSKIESDTRKYVSRAQGDVFVFTGPLFLGNVSTIGGNKVWVPSHVYKLVYDPINNKSWAFVLENNASAVIGKPMSYREFVKMTGLDFLGS